MLGVDGVSDFGALHSGRHNDEVQLCAFDILVEGDDDLRSSPFICARSTLNACWHAGPKASSSERGEIAPICFGRPARWALKVLCRSDATGLIKLAGRSIG